MFFRLKTLFQWEPDAEEFTASLTTPAPFAMRLHRFPKGVDNAHIDVLLSPRFTQVVRRIVQQLLQYEIGEIQIGRRTPPPSMADIDELHKVYSGLMDAAMGMARRNSRPEDIQLVQFAVLKFLLVLVREELAQYRERLNQARAGQPSQRSVQAHDLLVAFTHAEPMLHYQVAHKLLLQINKLESGSLRKLRKSMLGRSWPVPRELLFNPMLQLSSLWADEQLMRHYTLLGTDKDDLKEFSRVNWMILELFGRFLPAWMAPKEQVETGGQTGIDGDTGVRERLDQGLLNGFLEVELLLGRTLQDEEYRQGLVSWFDEPANIVQIVRAGRFSNERRASPATPEAQRRRQRFYTYLLEKIQFQFRNTGLLQRVLAAREAPAAHGELDGAIPVRLIIEYLQGGLSRGKLLRRLSGMRGVSDPASVVRLLDQKRTGLRRMPKAQKEEAVYTFLADFATLRRDLKLAYRGYWIMNQLRLLDRQDEIELSRRNGSLHEFLLTSERGADQHEIRGHVILKADLRGSTTITNQLREKNLNPATHFSRNFFEPITKLLPDFGAKKVFVEGDAVILCIYEYDDQPNEWLSVARACGLARQMLAVVDAQNAQNRKYGLPELELGLGIAFRNEAPAFLYDGDHEITISPAINRADRLSSCAASLRSTELGRRISRGVEVVEPVDQGIMQKETSDKLLRYNVNGIELDGDAFFKLKTEVALHHVNRPLPGYDENSAFYVGRYPDRQGRMNWLVVREAPIRLWIGNSVSAQELGGRQFYEVITRPDSLALIKELLGNGRRSAEAAGEGENGAE